MRHLCNRQLVSYNFLTTPHPNSPPSSTNDSPLHTSSSYPPATTDSRLRQPSSSYPAYPPPSGSYPAPPRYLCYPAQSFPKDNVHARSEPVGQACLSAVAHGPAPAAHALHRALAASPPQETHRTPPRNTSGRPRPPAASMCEDSVLQRFPSFRVRQSRTGQSLQGECAPSPCCEALPAALGRRANAPRRSFLCKTTHRLRSPASAPPAHRSSTRAPGSALRPANSSLRPSA